MEGEMAVVYTLSGTEGTELPDVITVNTVFCIECLLFCLVFHFGFSVN